MSDKLGQYKWFSTKWNRSFFGQNWNLSVRMFLQINVNLIPAQNRHFFCNSFLFEREMSILKVLAYYFRYFCSKRETHIFSFFFVENEKKGDSLAFLPSQEWSRHQLYTARGKEFHRDRFTMPLMDFHILPSPDSPTLIKHIQISKLVITKRRIIIYSYRSPFRCWRKK